MLELRRRTNTDPFQDLVAWMTGDPLAHRSLMPFFEEEGNLALDVSEGDKEVIVRANLPGFDKDDIDVQLHNGVLTIKAEHTEESETKDERFYRRERRFGAVNRRVALPGVVADDKVEAALKDGVLTLRVPRAEHDRPKRVEIR